jgi:hypothetical protein
VLQASGALELQASEVFLSPHLISLNAEVANFRTTASSELQSFDTSELWASEDLPSSQSISLNAESLNFQSLINTHTPEGCYVSKEGSGHVAKLTGDTWSN